MGKQVAAELKENIAKTKVDALYIESVLKIRTEKRAYSSAG